MKRLVMLAVLIAPFAFSADPFVVVESSAPFEGAIEGISDFVEIAHLPGYGLNVNARLYSEFDEETVVEQLENVVLGLSALVRGLDDGDFVSVAWSGEYFNQSPVMVVVRMVPGDPSSLETYVNGVLQ